MWSVTRKIDSPWIRSDTKMAYSLREKVWQILEKHFSSNILTIVLRYGSHAAIYGCNCLRLHLTNTIYRVSRRRVKHAEIQNHLVRRLLRFWQRAVRRKSEDG